MTTTVPLGGPTPSLDPPLPRTRDAAGVSMLVKITHKSPITHFKPLLLPEPSAKPHPSPVMSPSRLVVICLSFKLLDSFQMKWSFEVLVVNGL